MSFDAVEWLRGAVTVSGESSEGLPPADSQKGEEDVLDGGRRPRAQRTVRPWASLFNGAITDGARLLKLVALVTHKIRFERWFTASYAQNQWTTPWMMSRPAKIFADGCPSG